MPKKFKTKSKEATTFQTKTTYDENFRTVDGENLVAYDTMQQQAHEFDDAIMDIRIDETAEVPKHHFAQKKNMKSKQTEEEKDRFAEEDPFAMLANCSRFTASKEMKLIKDSLSKIEGLMTGNLPTEKTQFLKEQTVRIAAYNEVISYCKAYVESKNPNTANGKRRLKMIRNILATCEQEQAAFETTSAEAFENIEEGEEKSWLSILSEIRSVSVNMDEPGKQVEIGGAGTSEVLICHIEDKKYYFKEDEVLDNSQPIDVLIREMKDAPESSVPHRIKRILEEHEDLTESFKDLFNNIMDIDSIYSIEVNAESIPQIKNILVKYLGANQSILDLMLDNVENAKAFMSYAANLKKNENKRLICEGAKIKEGAVISSHNIATSRVANLLGQPEVIAASKKVNLTYKGKTISGNMMDEAEGTDYTHLDMEAKEKNIQIKFSPEAICQMQTLQILDYLCGQIDRNMGNFLCVVDKSKEPWTISKVTGIDNDMSFGELDLKKVQKSNYNKLPRMFDKNGKFTISALDSSLVTNLMSLTPELLKFTLADLIAPNALEAAAKRLLTLQEIVRNAINNGDTKLLDKNNPDGWEEANAKKPAKYIA